MENKHAAVALPSDKPLLTDSVFTGVVKRHMEKHGGYFSPEMFVREAVDLKHPAHGWFTWDDTVAAHRYRVKVETPLFIIAHSEQTRVLQGPFSYRFKEDRALSKIEVKDIPIPLSDEHNNAASNRQMPIRQIPLQRPTSELLRSWMIAHNHGIPQFIKNRLISVVDQLASYEKNKTS